MSDVAIARSGLVIACAALAACRSDPPSAGQREPSTASAPSDAAPADANLDGCRSAARRAAGLAPPERAQALIDGCQPCGDWKPLLTWSTLQIEGGPTRAAIEQAMLACRGYCDSSAKQRFLGTLDAARGHNSRLPWRLLGELCKAQVSAVPDTRFMSGPYFALDRIARALADPALLAPLALPLPAVSLTGVGVSLPSAARTAPTAGPAALTVDASQILVGSLPIAALSAAGIQVSGDYPGAPVEPTALAAALAVPALASQPVAVLAPYGLSAARVAEVVAHAGGRELRLAAALPGPGGWTVPGTIPVALLGEPRAAHPTTGPRPGSAAPAPGPGIALSLGSADAAIAAAHAASPEALHRAPVAIVIDDTATVDGLARVLAALSSLDVTSAALVHRATKP